MTPYRTAPPAPAKLVLTGPLLFRERCALESIYNKAPRGWRVLLAEVKVPWWAHRRRTIDLLVTRGLVEVGWDTGIGVGDGCEWVRLTPAGIALVGLPLPDFLRLGVGP